MRSVRHLVIGAATLALTLSAIGAPVSAAGSGKVAVINGFPGKRIDVCVKGKEIKSALRYGKVAFRKLKAGPKTIKFYKKNRRVCKGKLLAKQSFPFPGGSDLTIVMTKSGPRIQRFDNTVFADVSGSWSVFFWRNASDIAGVALDLAGDNPILDEVQPSMDPVFAKGDQFVTGENTPGLFVITTVFSVADTATILVEPEARLVKLLYRYEWILIGSHPANARLVVLKRAIPPFS